MPRAVARSATEVLLAAAGGALKDGDRFVALLSSDGDYSEWRVHDASRAKFSSHGLEWELALEGPDAPAGPVRVGLRLLGGGSRKRVVYEIGLVNLDEEHPDFAVRCEEALSDDTVAATDLAPPDLDSLVEEGWRNSGCVSPYVRILEVADVPAGGAAAAAQ